MESITKDNIDEASKEFIEVALNYFEINKDYPNKQRELFQTALLKHLRATFDGHPGYTTKVYLSGSDIGDFSYRIGNKIGSVCCCVIKELLDIKTPEEFILLIQGWIRGLVIHTPCFDVRDTQKNSYELAAIEIYVRETFIKRIKERVLLRQ